MLIQHKCKACGTTNVLNINKLLLHKEVNPNEGGALLGDEMLEVEETVVEPKRCLGCGELLNI